MLNRLISLTEGDLHRIVREVLNEDKLGLLEYHAQQKLPFDDDFYGKKNQAEHYLDWLEEFGKYGKIGNSSLALQDCVESGAKMAIEKGRIRSTDLNDNLDDLYNHIANKLMNNKFKYITFDNRNNIYVERAIKISDSIDSVAIDLFSLLTDKYENNVGGCWAFKSGMGYAYCSEEYGSKLLLKGWIRLEDVDWLKTCDLNYNQDEFEIRVKPNAKVELFEVIADGKYKLPLYDTLVVSSTYFGNRQGYKGDIATVDDGMGHVTLINRKGEYLNPDLWFDEIDEFYNGFARVKLNGEGWNFIRQDGTLLSPDNGEDIRDIVDYVGNFSEGFAKVEFQEKWNFIRQDGSLLSPNQWFDKVDYFSEGVASVEIEDKGWNFIRQDGSLLSPDQWFDDVWKFENGFARVKIRGEGYNFIKLDGSYLFNQWFEYDNVDDFKDGVARVYLINKGYNFIKLDSSYLSPNQWFYDADDFENGFARVELYDKGYNFLKLDGTYLSPNQWFDRAGEFKNGVARVRLEDKGWNFIKPDGSYLFNQWFDDVGDFSEGVAGVEIKDKGYNFIRKDGSLLFPNKWYDNVGNFYNGFARVYLINKGYNLIKQDGSLLSPNKWYSELGYFENGFARVMIRGKWYKLNQDGRLCDWDGYLLESINLRDSYLHRVLNESIKKVLKGNIYRR